VTAIEYKGIEIQIVQTANPTGFRWTVHLDDNRVRTGESHSRLAAISSAERAIDKAGKYHPKEK
jgi:hypothetical protein